MPQATAITLHQASRVLEVAFEDGASFRLPAEYLRVHSPSAEVQGHGPGQRLLVAGKRQVNIRAIEPVGHYGVLLRFDDGHATGIYTFERLLASCPCDPCAGSGAKAGTKPKNCAMCGGAGRIRQAQGFFTLRE